MKSIIFTVILLPLLTKVYAQDFVDNALLFSRTQVAGSARMQGLGGAQVSLGGDYSSALVNPAGLGMFNRSEFTFSLGTFNNQTSAAYLGNDSEDSKSVLTIPGISYVQKHNYTKDKFLGGAFGISYSRINSFNTQYQYAGDNAESSMLDYFISYANGLSPSDLENDYFYTPTGLAYNGYRLIDEFDDGSGNLFWDTELYPVDVNGNYDYPTVRQAEQLIRRGSQSQVSLSYGGNYDDVFFFGATLGILNLNFRQEQVYSESNFRYAQTPGFNPLDDFQLDENFEIQGSGVNLTLGTIYRPVNFLQMGLSFTTPTLYNITDTYNARLDSRWNNYDYPNTTPALSNESAEFDVPLISEYDFSTPAKLNTGVTFISKYGFISGEVEFINYAKARYSSTIAGISFSPENNDINSSYKKAVNFKVGGEFRYKIFRARAGYNFMADPYRDTSFGNIQAINGSTTSISAGLGIRTTKFFIDFATVRAETEQRRTPYVTDNSPTAVLGIVNTSYLVTVGFPF
jgi:hypothetical protein